MDSVGAGNKELLIPIAHPFRETRVTIRPRRLEREAVHLCVEGEYIADQLRYLREAASHEAFEAAVRPLEPFQAGVLVAQGGAQPGL